MLDKKKEEEEPDANGIDTVSTISLMKFRPFKSFSNNNRFDRFTENSLDSFSKRLPARELICNGRFVTNFDCRNRMRCM